MLRVSSIANLLSPSKSIKRDNEFQVFDWNPKWWQVFIVIGQIRALGHEEKS
jgi:hypothetical protein